MVSLATLMGFDPTISNNYKLALSRLSYRAILAPTEAICIRLGFE